MLPKPLIIAILPKEKGEKTVTESAKKLFGRHGNGKVKCTGDLDAFYYRMHTGDENGKTTYKWGEIVLCDLAEQKIVSKCSAVKEKDASYIITLANETSEGAGNESSSSWNAKPGYVMIGRIHVGDENEPSTIISKQIVVKDKNTNTVLALKADETTPVTSNKESDGTNVQFPLENAVKIEGIPTTLYLPITGRTHSGDENGKTVTTFTKYSLAGEA